MRAAYKQEELQKGLEVIIHFMDEESVTSNWCSIQMIDNVSVFIGDWHVQKISFSEGEALILFFSVVRGGKERT